MDDVRELVTCLSRGERGYTKLINRIFKEAGYDLSREQYELLQVLWREDHLNQQSISKRLQKDKYSVTKLLNTLARHGYVRRIVSRKDRRSNVVILTEKGKESERTLTEIEEQVHENLVLTIATPEIRSCVWVLKKLANIME